MRPTDLITSAFFESLSTNPNTPRSLWGTMYTSIEPPSYATHVALTTRKPESHGGRRREWNYLLLAYVWWQCKESPTRTAERLNEYAKDDRLRFGRFKGIEMREVSAIMHRLTSATPTSKPHVSFWREGNSPEGVTHVAISAGLDESGHRASEVAKFMDYAVRESGGGLRHISFGP